MRSSWQEYRDVGLLIIRVGLGVAFVMHGWPKLSGGRATWEGIGAAAGMPLPVVAGFIGAIIEVLGGILLGIGFVFRPVCALLFLQMMVALFMVHLRHGDEFNTYSHALEDGVVFLGLFFTGPGKHSVDGK
jgi:putative oxidoreductase